jgi:dienelactone hydrolase
MRLSRRQFGLLSFGSVVAPAVARAQRLPSVLEVPWLGEIQTPPKALPPDVQPLRSLLMDAQGNKLANLEHWKQQRSQLREAWLNLLGVWPSPRRPPEYEILESTRTATILRQLIRYDTEWGVKCEAYLLRPSPAQQQMPAVVVFHSTVDYTIRQGAGLEGPPQAAWGLKLAERGFVVLCPRCFLWNDGRDVDYMTRVKEHRSRHPQAPGMAKMLCDGMRAVDLLASQPGVDPRRIGAAGHSLGAKEVLYLAALDERIKAAVSSEGGIGRTFSNWEAPWYLATKHFGREHHELLGLAAPRAFLLIGGGSADGVKSWPYIEAALEAYRMYGPVARVGLFNHGQGHTIPPVAEQRTYEWLQTYL